MRRIRSGIQSRAGGSRRSSMALSPFPSRQGYPRPNPPLAPEFLVPCSLRFVAVSAVARSATKGWGIISMTKSVAFMFCPCIVRGRGPGALNLNRRLRVPVGCGTQGRQSCPRSQRGTEHSPSPCGGGRVGHRLQESSRCVPMFLKNIAPGCRTRTRNGIRLNDFSHGYKPQRVLADGCKQVPVYRRTRQAMEVAL